MSATPPTRILQVILEAVLQTEPDQFIGQGDQDILVDNRRKIRGKYILKPGRTKEGRVEEELNTDAQKGDDSRVPVGIWDRREWDYEGERESGDLKVLWESMPIWWRRKLTRGFYQVLRRSSGTRKQVDSSQGIREVEVEYVWIEGERKSYLKYIRKILKNKDWEAGVDYLEQAMGSSQLECLVGSRCFLWR